MKLTRTKTPVYDNNVKCPACGKYYAEGQGFNWHWRAKHDVNADWYHRALKAAGMKGSKGK